MGTPVDEFSRLIVDVAIVLSNILIFIWVRFNLLSD